jgi:hypothetical protein
MKKSILALFLFVTLFLFLFALQSIKPIVASPPYTSGISIISPQNTTYGLEPLTLEINETVLFNYNINHHITYSVDGADNITIPRQTSDSEGIDPYIGEITGTVPLPELSKGSHYISVYQETMYPDHLSITAWQYSKVTVYFTVNDNQPPTVLVSSIENKSYSQTTFDLNFTVDMPTSWVGYSLDDHANITITENTTLTGLSEGPHNLRVYANDTVGNMGASQPIVFSVGFFPTIPVVIGSLAAGVVVGVFLVVFFKKRKHQLIG